MLDNKYTVKQLADFYDKLNLGFDGLKIKQEKFDPKRLPEDIPETFLKLIIQDLEGSYLFIIKTRHKKFDEKNKNVDDVEFDKRSQESAGTNKVFNISGLIFDVLNNGGVLVVDQLDSSLHPLLTLAISRLFNSEIENTKNAQLIFTTHDTNLFSYGKYRRDQIYFVEKNKYGASDLYSLVEYREVDGAKVRKDRSFESVYIQGRYGAIPYIGDIAKVAME